MNWQTIVRGRICHVFTSLTTIMVMCVSYKHVYKLLPPHITWSTQRTS